MVDDENIDEGYVEPEPEQEPEPEEPVEPTPPPTGLPNYLYIKTGIGTYTVVDRVFGSKSEAEKFAKEQFPKTKFKIMNETEIKAYTEKQAKIEAKLSEAKTIMKEGSQTVGRGAKKIGKAFVTASRDVARTEGMTRQQMQPRIERLWGYPKQQPQYPQQPPGQQPNININIGNQQAPPPEEEKEETQEEYQEQRRPRFNMQPPYQRRRLNIQTPQQYQRGRLNIPAPTQYRRGSLNIPPPPQTNRRMNIPEGGGIFRPAGKITVKEEKRKLKISKGAGIYDKPANIPPEAPIAKRRFDFSFPPKYHTPFGRGRPLPQTQPYEEVEETTKKIKKYHHHKKKKR